MPGVLLVEKSRFLKGSFRGGVPEGLGKGKLEAGRLHIRLCKSPETHSCVCVHV